MTAATPPPPRDGEVCPSPVCDYPDHGWRPAAPSEPPAGGVDPAEIVRQRAIGWPDFHPEDFCHQCGRPNPTWFADTAEWQAATGSTGDGGGILCPSCFAALYRRVTGRDAIIWRLSVDPRSRDAEPPAEAQQDDEPTRPIAHRDAAGVLWVPVELDPAWTRLAARPPADTETRVDYLCLGHPAWPGNLAVSNMAEAQRWFDEHSATHPVRVVKRTTTRETVLRAALDAR